MAVLGRRRSGFGNTVRLGLRLARAGGKARMSLVVFGAFLGSVLILISFSVQHAVDQQWERMMDRTEYYGQEPALEDDGFYGEIINEPTAYPDNALDETSTLHTGVGDKSKFGISGPAKIVLMTGDGPVPPGIADTPKPGTAYLSPALFEKVRTSQVAARAVAGMELKQISAAGLLHPGELVAYIGAELDEFDAEIFDQRPVLSWGVNYGWLTQYMNPNQGAAFPIFAFMLMPAVVLLATTTRLASSVRTERMAALRLLGVGRMRTQLIAGIEAGSLAVVGVLAGTAAIPLIARLTAGKEFFKMQWFASDFRPSLGLFIATLMFIPLLTAATSLVVLRKIASNPLQIRRKSANPRPSYWRLVPLVLGAVIAGLIIGRAFRKLGEIEQAVSAYVFLLAAVLLGIGILVAVPVLVRRLAAFLGRKTSRATLLLAARRTQYEPAVLNRLVGGLVLVLFIATGGQAVVLAFESTPQYQRAHAATSGDHTYISVIPEDPSSSQSHGLDAAQLLDISSVTGVEPLTVLEGSADGPEFGPLHVRALVATCAELETWAEIDGECVEGKPLMMRGFFGSPTNVVLEYGGETATIAITDVAPQRFVNTTEQIANFEVLLPPDTPELAALSDLQPNSWILQTPPHEEAWLLADTEVREISPAHWVLTPDTYALQEVQNVRLGIWIGTAIAGSIALITLLITAVDNGIARRPQIAMQRAFGVSLARVRRTQVLQALLPLAVGMPLAGGAGLLAGQAYTTLDDMKITTSYWSSIGIALGLAAVAALLVALATLPAIGGKLTARSLRRE